MTSCERSAAARTLDFERTNTMPSSQYHPATYDKFYTHKKKVGEYKFFIGLLLILAILISLGVRYSGNAGHLVDRPLNAEYFKIENPAQRKLNIENCNELACTVTSIDKYSWAGVLCKLEGNSDVLVRAYLNQKDVAKLAPGDSIYIKGNITYFQTNGAYKHSITVGSSVTMPMLLFNAKLCDIVKTAPDK